MRLTGAESGRRSGTRCLCRGGLSLRLTVVMPMTQSADIVDRGALAP